MVSWLLANPGRLYVVATLLPLAAFGLLLVGGCLRSLCRPYRDANGLARFGFYFLGGNRPLRAGAYFATGGTGSLDAATLAAIAGNTASTSNNDLFGVFTLSM